MFNKFVNKLLGLKRRKSKAGCYMIIDKYTKEPLYVGESQNIPKRLEHHKVEKQHGEYRYVMYKPEKHLIEIFPMPNSTKKERNLKKEKLIEKHHPKRNKRTYDHLSSKEEQTGIKIVIGLMAIGLLISWLRG